jgi:hypothetical protein
MNTKRIWSVARVHITYVVVLWLLLFSTSYLFMDVFHWGLFLSAPVSSLVSVGLAETIRRRLEKIPVSKTSDVDRQGE